MIQINMNRNGNDHLMCRPPLFCWRVVPWFMIEINAHSYRNNHVGNPSVLAREEYQKGVVIPLTYLFNNKSLDEGVFNFLKEDTLKSLKLL